MLPPSPVVGGSASLPSRVEESGPTKRHDVIAVHKLCKILSARLGGTQALSNEMMAMGCSRCFDFFSRLCCRQSRSCLALDIPAVGAHRCEEQLPVSASRSLLAPSLFSPLSCLPLVAVDDRNICYSRGSSLSLTIKISPRSLSPPAHALLGQGIRWIDRCRSWLTLPPCDCCPCV